MDKQEFFSLCDKYLHFLIDEYECSVQYSDLRLDNGICYGYVVQYQNNTTAVNATFEFPDVYLHFHVGQLIDGHLYDNPVIITPNSALHSYEIETLLKVRAPEYQLPHPPSYTGDSDRTYVEAKLSRAADALRCYADDILKGDFSVFPALREIIMERVNGKQGTKSLPPDINKYVKEKIADYWREIAKRKK